jgi:hypothetical protein
MQYMTVNHYFHFNKTTVMTLRNIKVFILVPLAAGVKQIEAFLWAAFPELISNNFKITTYSTVSFQAAQQLLSEVGKTKYDICILDSDLAGENLELLDQVKINFPEAKVVLYSDNNRLVSVAVEKGAFMTLSPSLVKEMYGTAVMLYEAME